MGVMSLEPLSLLGYAGGSWSSFKKRPILSCLAWVSMLLIVLGVIGLMGVLPINLDELSNPWNLFLDWAVFVFAGFVGLMVCSVTGLWLKLSESTKGFED